MMRFAAVVALSIGLSTWSPAETNLLISGSERGWVTLGEADFVRVNGDENTLDLARRHGNLQRYANRCDTHEEAIQKL